MTWVRAGTPAPCIPTEDRGDEGREKVATLVAAHGILVNDCVSPFPHTREILQMWSGSGRIVAEPYARHRDWRLGVEETTGKR